MMEPDIPNDLLIGQNNMNKFAGINPIMDGIPGIINMPNF